MLRSLPILWLCLILAGCEKPAPAGESGSTSAPATPSGSRGHEPREPAPPAPREILEAAEKLESPSEREKAIASVAWNAIETDPELAHEAFLKLPPDSPERMRLVQHYAMTLAESDVNAALAWAEALGSESEVAAAKQHIALAIAETDPRRAAQLVSESAIAGRDLDVAVVQVIQRWAVKSAPEAAAWVASFPSGAAREAGIRSVAERWLPSDAKAAFAWLGGIKDAEIRSEAARAMEGIILQQPENIRNAWLEHADAGIREELDRQRGQALLDVGDNIPIPEE